MIQILNKPTRFKSMIGTIEVWKIVADKLGINIDIVIGKTSNWIFSVEVELSIILDGDIESINTFEKIINNE